MGGCPCSKLIHFRRGHPLLGRAEFLTSEDISWYDEDWANPESRFLAFTLHDRSLPCPHPSGPLMKYALHAALSPSALTPHCTAKQRFGS